MLREDASAGLVACYVAMGQRRVLRRRDGPVRGRACVSGRHRDSVQSRPAPALWLSTVPRRRRSGPTTCP